MGEFTGIAWTNHTFNPWWGCTKVSAGCANCYADKSSNRWGLKLWGKDADRKFFTDKHWKEPLKWNRAAEANKKSELVFCGSMCDIMEDRDDLIDPRKRLFKLVEETPWLTWQLLTKRPENFLKFLPEEWLSTPKTNVWLMTTVENDDNRWRAEELVKVPAKIRGLSMEPLIGSVELSDEVLKKIDWVIIGGESGSEARVCDLSWKDKIVSDCKRLGVKIFVKQLGSKYRIDGNEKVSKLKGPEFEEFPSNLRIREIPICGTV